MKSFAILTERQSLNLLLYLYPPLGWRPNSPDKHETPTCDARCEEPRHRIIKKHQARRHSL